MQALLAHKGHRATRVTTGPPGHRARKALREQQVHKALKARWAMPVQPVHRDPRVTPDRKVLQDLPAHRACRAIQV